MLARFTFSAVGFLLLAFGVSAFAMTEADILLSFAALRTPGSTPLQGWNSSNIANLCVNWEGIACREGKVSDISIISPDPRSGLPPRLSGRLPAGLGNLTSLETLEIFQCKLVGVLPKELFLLPNLWFVNLNGVPVDVAFPPVVQSPISTLILQGTDLSGHIPEFADWSRLETLDFKQTRVTCNLPAGFLSAIETNRLSPDLECELYKTLLKVDDNNLLCGQIHISRVPCGVYPFLGGFERATDPPLFRTRFNDATVSVTKNIISFFPTYNGRNGSILDYTAEYLSIRVFPVDVSRPKRLNFATTGFQTFSRSANNLILTFNSTLTTLDDPDLVVRAEFVLYSLPPISSDGAKRRFKFSCNYHLISGSWPLNTTSGAFGVTASYRTAHSPQSGITSCNNQSGLAIQGLCTSPLTEVDFSPEPDLTYRGTVATKTIEIVFSFGIVGTSDGRLLTFGNSRIEADVLLNPSGFLDIINSYNLYAPFDKTGGPEKDQSVLAFVQIVFPIFNQSLLYDPDLSLRLLFDPDSALPPEQSGEQLSAGISAGVIAAIVVTIVVVVVGISVFGAFIFPYMKRRQVDNASGMGTADDDEIKSSTNGDSDRRWTAAAPNERTKS